MNSRIAYIIAVVFLVAGWWLYYSRYTATKVPPVVKQPIQPSPTEATTPSPTPVPHTQSLFIPYWADVTGNETFDGYDRLIYFGLTANRSGIVTSDQGYTKFDAFLQLSAPGRQKWVAVRMLDSDLNTNIIKDEKAWEPIAKGMIATVKDNKLDGIVFDFELTGIAFDSLTNDITKFYRYLYDATKNEQIPFAITMYGDVISRHRPYDIARLRYLCNEMMIMAYDFHKSRGEPGPNFPLAGKDTYGYDMHLMADDFLKYVPAENLSVIFGMYGYDWTVDERKRPISQAKAVTLTQINDKFVSNCQLKNCVLTRSEAAGENEVDYVDQYDGLHVVWYEDEESVKRKTEYLESRGITKYARWAYGYF